MLAAAPYLTPGIFCLIRGSLDIFIGVIAAVLTARLLNRFGNTCGSVLGQYVTVVIAVEKASEAFGALQ